MISAFVASVLLLTLPAVPGSFNPQVKQATLPTTVCVPGYSASVRPSFGWSGRYKTRLLNGRPEAAFQLDHLVSLSLGGAPYSRRNLWLQPIRQASADDRLESYWHRELCAGHLSLRDARRIEIAYKLRYG